MVCISFSLKPPLPSSNAKLLSTKQFTALVFHTTAFFITLSAMIFPVFVTHTAYYSAYLFALRWSNYLTSAQRWQTTLHEATSWILRRLRMRMRTGSERQKIKIESWSIKSHHNEIMLKLAQWSFDKYFFTDPYPGYFPNRRPPFSISVGWINSLRIKLELINWKINFFATSSQIHDFLGCISRNDFFFTTVKTDFTFKNKFLSISDE